MDQEKHREQRDYLIKEVKRRTDMLCCEISAQNPIKSLIIEYQQMIKGSLSALVKLETLEYNQLVGIYEISRHYGGHEEGDWYYSNSTHQKSLNLVGSYNGIKNQIKELEAHLAVKAKRRDYNSISSQATINDPMADIVDDYCRGEISSGGELAVYTEDVSGDQQDHNRPHYE